MLHLNFYNFHELINSNYLTYGKFRDIQIFQSCPQLITNNVYFGLFDILVLIRNVGNKIIFWTII